MLFSRRAFNNFKGVGTRLPNAADQGEAINDQLQKEAAANFQRQSAESMFSTPLGNIGRVPLMYIDPMFDPILLMFPKENIRELNRRLRHYYVYHPYVRAAIDLHSNFPLTDFELRCENKEIERYYNNLKDKLNLLQLMTALNRDYWLLGEAFLFGNWDSTEEEWSEFNQYPPENIDVHRTFVGKDAAYFLKPDEELKKVLNSSDEADQAVANALPADFRAAVSAGTPYQLDNGRLIHFARRPSLYTLRGESICKSCLKDLLYEDKVRLLQYTQIDRNMQPIKIWKLGSKEKGWIPPKRHFEDFEQLLAQACFSEDTELLTEKGFKRFDEIDKENEKIAAFNPETEKIEYRKPTKWNVYDHNGEMINFKTPYCDLLVTPNHKMWTQSWNKSRKTGEFYPWKMLEASEIKVGHRFRSVEGAYPCLTNKKQIGKVTYEGMVFCPTVPPYHLVVARRNGKVVVTGQSNDPDFNIIYHPFVEADFKTTVNLKEDLIKHFDLVAKRLMIGLFVNENALGGSDSPYAAQSMSMKSLMHRYLINRHELERLIVEKIFLPLAVKRGFIRKSTEKSEYNTKSTYGDYILPTFFWKGPNLLNSTALQEMVIRLRKDKEIPFELLADIFGWDKESISSALKKEEGTPLDLLYKKVRETISADVSVAKQILEGKKTEEWKIPAGMGEKKPAGRPALEEMKSVAPPAITGKTAVPPREVLKETKEGLAKPLGEAGPTAKEEGKTPPPGPGMAPEGLI